MPGGGGGEDSGSHHSKAVGFGSGAPSVDVHVGEEGSVKQLDGAAARKASGTTRGSATRLSKTSRFDANPVETVPRRVSSLSSAKPGARPAIGGGGTDSPGGMRKGSGKRTMSILFDRSAESDQFQSSYGKVVPGARAARQDPMKEVQLSQVRNKALKKLGFGLNDASPVIKPWISPFKPWMADAHMEKDYREAAFALQKRFLLRLMLYGGLAYLALALFWALFLAFDVTVFVGSGSGEGCDGDGTAAAAASGSSTACGLRAATVALRLVAPVAALSIAALISYTRAGPYTVGLCVLMTLYLVGSIPLVELARRASSGEEHAGETLFIYLIAYRLLVPIFQIRHVALAMWGLTLAQLAATLALYSDALPSRATVAARGLLQAVALNVIGAAMGLIAERNRRKSFMGALLYQEEVVLMTAVRNDVQRLLLNTLPEPIVREIASGKVEVAHRYEAVTVLQVDMVGFTPLSSTRPPSEVLGILSDLFNEFDEMAERYGVHKVKTIGDAYIACAGAFPIYTDSKAGGGGGGGDGHNDGGGAVAAPSYGARASSYGTGGGGQENRDTPAASAERAVNLALAIQESVLDKAITSGVNIGARVGVHTGPVMGGIIGTVRFHFDMWGNGVSGAVKMEELGQQGRVHVSNTTAALLPNLPLEPSGQSYGLEYQTTYGITSSYLVDGSSIDLAQYAVYSAQDVGVSTEYDLSELLGESAIDVERSIAVHADRQESSTKAGGSAGGSGGGGASGSDGTGGGSTRTSGRRSSGGGFGAMPSRFLTSLFHSPVGLGLGGSGERSSTFGGGRPGLMRKSTWGVGAKGWGAAAANKRNSSSGGGGSASTPDKSSSSSSSSGGGAGGRKTMSADMGSPSGTPAPHNPWLDAGNPSASTSGQSEFLFRRQSTMANLGEDKSLQSLNKKDKERLQRAAGTHATQALAYLQEQVEILSSLVVIFGLYDLLYYYHSARLLGWPRLLLVLGVRYFAILPALALLRTVAERLKNDQEVASKRPGSATAARPADYSHVVRACVVGVSALGVVALMAAAPPELRRCGAAASAGYRNQTALGGGAGGGGGGGGGFQTLPVTCGRRGALGSFSIVDPINGEEVTAAGYPLVQGDHTIGDGFSEDGECVLLDDDGVLYCATVVAADYLKTLGVIHTFLHYTLIHARVPTLLLLGGAGSILQLSVAYLREELSGALDASAVANARSAALSSLVMPLTLVVITHLIGLLAYYLHRATLQQQNVLATRQQALLGIIREETEQCETLLKNILPPHLIGTLAGMVELQSKRQMLQNPTSFASNNPQLLAQQYHDCTFLFAKIGGLSQLVNDPQRSPKQVMKVLQRLFDTFDKLCDIYKVQKVRKTANEYYLVAAGLPDPRLLPSARDRACGIAAFAFAIIGCMDVLNSELKPLGISFELQVGLHSGGAIAGIIGLKTFQYDLCGDAVNTAARMCSYSKSGHVNVSDDTYRLLAHRYLAVSRGKSEVKGKGLMEQYFLLNLPADAIRSADEIAGKLTIGMGQRHGNDGGGGGGSGAIRFEPPIKPLEA